MTRYTIEVNKKGTIVAFNVIDADPARYPTRDLTGRHFSYLIGDDCRKDLRDIFHRITKTRQPASFRTFFRPKGTHEGPVVEWTVQPKSVSVFAMPRFVLVGRDPE